MICVPPSLLGLSSYTAAWIICTCIIQITFKPLIDIDFSVTLRCFTSQPFETTKLTYDINIDQCRKQEARDEVSSGLKQTWGQLLLKSN